LLFQHITCFPFKLWPVVLYGCENWSVILREAYRLRVFGDRVLRKIFGVERGHKTGE